MFYTWRINSIIIAILFGIFVADCPGGEIKYASASRTTKLSSAKLTFGYVAAVQDPFMVLIRNGAEDKANELGNVEIISQIPGVWNVDVQYANTAFLLAFSLHPAEEPVQPKQLKGEVGALGYHLADVATIPRLPRMGHTPRQVSVLCPQPVTQENQTQ